MDATFDFYSASTVADLELRLSEMFLHERRGYVVGASLMKSVVPLLDDLDASAEESGMVDTILNRGGIFTGFFVGDDAAARLRIFGLE